MSYKKILLLLLFVHCVSSIVHCQTLKIPYQFGFEEGDPEINNWELNVGKRGKYCADQWVVGNLEFNEGYRSLYISSDKGLSAKYSMHPNVVVVSRTLELPTGNYDISFDWKSGGYATISDLFVCLLPEGYSISGEVLESNDTIGYFPKIFSRFCVPLTTVDGDFISLSDKRTWSNASFQTSVVAGRKLQLAFVWVNFNQDSTIANPLGACIDNIQITSAMCPKPENLKADASCGTINFSWDGFAPTYECGYKPLGSKYWNNVYDIDGEVDNPSFTFEDMPEGAYDLRVRAIDEGDTSAYVYLNTVVVWCPENHCFDFVTLDNKEVVLCEVGSVPSDGAVKFSPSAPSPSVGGNDVNARHIACWVQGMMDPNTGNRLPVIPEGSLASIRLGNENAGAQAERITYTFDVVGDLVLLMKYAVVLEKPGHDKTAGLGPDAGPDRTQDPYFGFEILKEDGTPIDASSTCGQASFSPDDQDAKWETYTPSPGLDIVWKPWTTIGVDLRPYKGQKIKIRLRSQDCRKSKHFGYGYFTLDCVDAVIKSEGCDKVTLEAPEGFYYNWYNNLGDNIKDKDKNKITADAIDGVEYFCDVTYKHDPNCGFVLSSAVTKQFPKAEFDYSWVPADCNNYVKFENKSYVYTVDNDGDTAIIEGKRCAHYEWEFEFEGSVTRADVVNPKYLMPNAGGKLKVKLLAQLEEEACKDIYETEIHVKPIYGHDTTLNARICFGDYYLLGKDNFIMSSGTYVDTMLNIWGCDSVVTLNLYVRPKLDDVVVYDTLCSIDPYEIGNYRFDSTGVYEVLLKTAEGCDSVVILHLEKMEPLAAYINDEYRWLCADDSLLLVEYDLVEGARNPFIYSVVYDSLAHSAGFVDVDNSVLDPTTQVFEILLPDNCRPNSYEANIVLKDTISTCGDVILPVNFDVYYSSKILEPKFDNLITVLSAEANGGYEFDEYRWFRDGVLIPDENNAFYYLNGGVFGSECYYLEVRRKDDGVVMRTCEICPGSGTPVDDIYTSEPYVVNTIVRSGEFVIIANITQADVSLYTTTGQLVDTQRIVSQSDLVKLTSSPGVYLLQIATATEIFTTKIIITE